jgi:mxaA protein
MTGDRQCALLLAVALAPAGGIGAEVAATPVMAVVEQPRPFGHAVGDVLTQRVRLDAGRTPAPADLVAPRRLSAWIDRRASRLERDADGRRWLAVDYQVVNAPRSQATVRIPEWRLAGDAMRPALLVPAWPVGVSAITPRAEPGTAEWQLRPDRPAPAIATAPLQRRLLLASVALAAWLAAWAGWVGWRRWRDARRLPFAAAWRTLRRADEREPASWRALHQAFDRSAGEVLRPSTLPHLFERAPQFETLRDRIERFYAQSAAQFFGDGGAAAADDAAPRALCRELLRIERRSSR